MKNVDNKCYFEWIIATTSQIKRTAILKIKYTFYIKSGIDYKCWCESELRAHTKRVAAHQFYFG